MKELWERIAKNWKTSGVAVIAFVLLIGKWFGIEVTQEEINTLLTGILAVILLFAKD